ncbi:MAG: hypothetical protein ACYDA6_01750 [Solirubrobacteraceae bacterium]
MDDDAIRALVSRLSRPHRSGGEVVERAAIMAAGADSTAVLAWIAAHDGQPEPVAQISSRRGLHGARSGGGESLRYVLPPGALSQATEPRESQDHAAADVEFVPEPSSSQ